MALVFMRYSKDPHLLAAEKVARELKRGFWKDKQPVAPWAWRSKKSKVVALP